MSLFPLSPRAGSTLGVIPSSSVLVAANLGLHSLKRSIQSRQILLVSHGKRRRNWNKEDSGGQCAPSGSPNSLSVLPRSFCFNSFFFFKDLFRNHTVELVLPGTTSSQEFGDVVKMQRWFKPWRVRVWLSGLLPRRSSANPARDGGVSRSKNSPQTCLPVLSCNKGGNPKQVGPC